MATSKILTATFSGSSLETYADQYAYQYDVGMQLQLIGLELPAYFEVHYSNQLDGGESKTVIGTSDIVDIPDSVFTSGAYVYAFVYLQDGATSGYTVYRVTIPTKKRPAVTDQTPSPEDASVIAQAIEALNQAAEVVESTPKWNIAFNDTDLTIEEVE